MIIKELCLLIDKKNTLEKELNDLNQNNGYPFNTPLETGYSKIRRKEILEELHKINNLKITK